MSKKFIPHLVVKRLDIAKGGKIMVDGTEVSLTELQVVGGITATAAELNILDGVTATAAELNILDGVTASAGDINNLTNSVGGATFVVGAEAADAITVNVQLNDADGTAMATAATVAFYLADDSAGQTPSTTAPTGGLAAGTDGAAVETLDNISGVLTSEADGDIDVVITDTGTPTFYLVLIMPNGSLVISGAITFA